jgi:hypothetical protein
MQLPETPTEDEIILQAKRNCDGFYTVDNLREALECFYLNGFQDEVCGTVESGCHYYRVSRWIMQTDSQGFHEVFSYSTPEEAAIEFGKIQFNLNSEDEAEQYYGEVFPMRYLRAANVAARGIGNAAGRTTFFSR